MICLPTPISGAEVAQVLVPGRARRAAAAGRDEPEHDVVTRLQPADVLADLLDDAGTLVTADDRQLERQVAGHEVLVGVTQPRRGQLDEDLPGLRRIELDLLDAPRRVGLPQDGGLGLHGWYPFSRSDGPNVPVPGQGGSTGSIRPDQSTSSVEPPARRTSARRAGELLGEGDDVVGEQGAGVVAEPAGESRAGAAGADGDRQRAAAGDRREDERAVGRLVGGVDPDARRRGVGGNGGVDGGIARRRDDEAHVVEIAGLVGPLVQLGDRRAVEHVRHAVGHDPDRGPGGGEAVDLAGSDRAGTDDQHRHVAQVEPDGVLERSHGEILTKLMKLLGI